MDVSMMRGGADCNTDHRMLRAKLVVEMKKAFRRNHRGEVLIRWNVAKLHGKGTNEREMETTRERFLKSIGEKLMKEWDKAASV